MSATKRRTAKRPKAKSIQRNLLGPCYGPNEEWRGAVVRRFLTRRRRGILLIADLLCDTDHFEWVSGNATCQPPGFLLACDGRHYYSPDHASDFWVRLEVEKEFRSRFDYQLYRVRRYNIKQDRLCLNGPISFASTLKDKFIRIFKADFGK